MKNIDNKDNKDNVGLDLINRISSNTFLTNILLIPTLIILGIINYKIIKYSDDIFESKYKLFFIVCFGILIIGTVLSSLYHYTMYKTRNTFISNILYNIGLLDKIVTGPLLVIICLILVINYFIYFSDTYDNTNDSFVIFIIGFIYFIFGILIYLYKSKFNIKNMDFINRIASKSLINNEILHTFFHYVIYTGFLLILFVYYYNHEHIYKWYAEHKNLNNIYFSIALILIVLFIIIRIIMKNIFKKNK
jgi:hypothetical protein